MKKKELSKLEKGSIIWHRRYGYSYVHEVKYTMFDQYFGIIVEPLTMVGKAILMKDFNSDIPQFLEDSLRRLQVVPDPSYELKKFNGRWHIGTQEGDGFRVPKWLDLESIMVNGGTAGEGGTKPGQEVRSEA